MIDKVSLLAQFAQTFTYDSLPKTTADDSKVQTALSVVFVATGAIAVMMVIIGAIKYSASQGDPQAISKAKGTILYAIIGLVISIFAVAIVDFVFGKVA